MKKSTFRRLAGQPYFEDLLKLHHADCMASNEDLTDYDIALKRLEEFKNEPVLPVPLIDGRDLIALGFQEGKEIGKVKKHLFDLQLEGHIETIGEGLLIAKEIYNERHRVPV